MENFSTDLLCKGSIALGTGCGQCARCRDQLERGIRPIPPMSERASRPRPFNIEDQQERDRLMSETLGYARVSLHKKEGTDLKGREFAYDALKHALMMGYRLVPPGEQAA